MKPSKDIGLIAVVVAIGCFVGLARIDSQSEYKELAFFVALLLWAFAATTMCIVAVRVAPKIWKRFFGKESSTSD